MSEENKVTEEVITEANDVPETPETPEVKTVRKELFDKQASELAALKKQLQARMTEDEIKEARLQELTDTIKGFERDKNVTDYTKSLLDAGVDTKHASSMAEQLADGDFTTFFIGLKNQFDVVRKQVKADLIKDAPKPPTGEASIGEITKEQFNKMDFAERQEVYMKDPDLYARLAK